MRLTMARIKTMVNIPAAETAAAVSSPDITLATERLARIRVTTNIRTAPRGVLMASMMDPVPFPKLDHLLRNGRRARYFWFPPEASHMVDVRDLIDPGRFLNDQVPGGQVLVADPAARRLPVLVTQGVDIGVFKPKDRYSTPY